MALQRACPDMPREKCTLVPTLAKFIVQLPRILIGIATLCSQISPCHSFPTQAWQLKKSRRKKTTTSKNASVFHGNTGRELRGMQTLIRQSQNNRCQNSASRSHGEKGGISFRLLFAVSKAARAARMLDARRISLCPRRKAARPCS